MLTFMDQVRSLAGCALDSLGLGATETSYPIIAELAWGASPGLPAAGAGVRSGPADHRLADQAALHLGPPARRVSVVRRCLARNLACYLLESMTPRADQNGLGLAHYANQAPAAAVEAVFAERGRCSVILAGHSIGGTLAAAVCRAQSGPRRRFLLIDAPLSFGCEGGPWSARWWQHRPPATSAPCGAGPCPARFSPTQVQPPRPRCFLASVRPTFSPACSMAGPWRFICAANAERSTNSRCRANCSRI